MVYSPPGPEIFDHSRYRSNAAFLDIDLRPEEVFHERGCPGIREWNGSGDHGFSPNADPGADGDPMKTMTFYWKMVVVASAFLVIVILGFWKHFHGNVLKPETGHGLSSAPLFEAHDRSVSILIKTVELSTGKPVNIPTSIRQSKSRYNQMKQAVLAFLEGPRKGKFQVPVPEGMALN